MNNKKVDIDKWLNQARIYVEPLEEHRRVEMLLMLVDQNERTSLQSHCLDDGPLSSDELVEYLLKVITSMYKRKKGTPTQNKDRFLRRTQQEGETIADYAADLRDTLYQAWPGLPRDQLEELFIVYFINGLTNGDMKAKLKVEWPKTLHKAIEIGQIYEDMLKNNRNLINQTEYMTPPGYSILESPASTNSAQTTRILRFTSSDGNSFLTPIIPKTPSRKTGTITLSAVDFPNKDDPQRKLKLNNVLVKYIPDTGASISVISESVANAIGA